MGAMSRSKGQRGEREITGIIKELTGWDVRRRVRQHDGDSDLEGVPGWSIEVKNCADLRVPEWWRQAVKQSGKDDMPVLFYKIPRKGWRALWPLNAMMMFETVEWDSLAMTCETSVEAWAAVAREVANG